ncbi:DUF2948 family protein [Methylobacterium platani]|uniref:DUF2948 domain-containing protein n=2 Tax=Methylobacterium platani TaxID=427683 RepID=A0A179SA05_9HYPH|nr:DUF2948 family protein [Methylobacterium platani]KMO12500.1 hypothetical protein SQ03_24175 [Methylobacterium platani JCM 14648]OAS24643.1 hypothetical protein A5481_12970 [Methylobacterium platani]
MELLKLAALDADDLAVISTHLQDAVLRTGDLAYLPRERRFALVARRFDWECPDGAPPRRRLTGLHFDRVLSVRCRNVSRDAPDTPLELLAVTFEPGEAPSGIATLVFAGGAAIRLELECIEAAMKDLGPVWQADSTPRHAARDMPLDAA